MGNGNISSSQQQSQGVTIGTQGNEDQPTPLGNDLHQPANGKDDRHIPNQDRSSATNQERADSGPEQNI